MNSATTHFPSQMAGTMALLPAARPHRFWLRCVVLLSFVCCFSTLRLACVMTSSRSCMSLSMAACCLRKVVTSWRRRCSSACASPSGGRIPFASLQLVVVLDVVTATVALRACQRQERWSIAARWQGVRLQIVDGEAALHGSCMLCRSNPLARADTATQCRQQQKRAEAYGRGRL